MGSLSDSSCLLLAAVTTVHSGGEANAVYFSLATAYSAGRLSDDDTGAGSVLRILIGQNISCVLWIPALPLPKPQRLIGRYKTASLRLCHALQQYGGNHPFLSLVLRTVCAPLSARD